MASSQLGARTAETLAETSHNRSSKLRKDIPKSWYSDVGGSQHVLLVMAPMVGQSDLAFRRLVRRHGAGVVYSEMFLAERFNLEASYRAQAFGNMIREDDHPLVVQFAANDPRHFTEAALRAQELGADGVDLNLGCPQHRARENHYGAWMTDPEDWDLCCAIVTAAASHPLLKLPVTVKMRLQPTVEATVKFACQLADAGASLLTVHGRQRGSEDRRRDGAADLDAIAQVVSALSHQRYGVPVVSNGNVRVGEDIVRNLRKTGAAGAMVGEHLLKDPAIFRKAILHFHHHESALEKKGTAAAAAPGADGCSDPETKGSACDLFETTDVTRIHVLKNYMGILLHGYEHEQLPTNVQLQNFVFGGGGGETGRTVIVRGEVPKPKLEDGAIPGKNGQWVRSPNAPAASCEEEEVACDDMERMSVWWTNVEVVKGHLKNMLGEKGQLVSRNTFKRAPTVLALLECVARRFGAGGAAQPAAAPLLR